MTNANYYANILTKMKQYEEVSGTVVGIIIMLVIISATIFITHIIRQSDSCEPILVNPQHSREETEYTKINPCTNEILGTVYFWGDKK